LLGRYGWFALCLLSATSAFGSLPVFENKTPAGFSPEDSTARQDFVEGSQITVRVDVNQAVTPTYPVIGHFHNVERAESLDTTSVDGGQVDVALTPGGDRPHGLDRARTDVDDVDADLLRPLCPQQ
jgi:hypothetical protein